MERWEVQALRNWTISSRNTPLWSCAEKTIVPRLMHANPSMHSFNFSLRNWSRTIDSSSSIRVRKNLQQQYTLKKTHILCFNSIAILKLGLWKTRRILFFANIVAAIGRWVGLWDFSDWWKWWITWTRIGCRSMGYFTCSAE